MNRGLAGVLGVFAVGMVAAPVSALSIVEARCTSVLEADGGCVFDGNDNDVPAIETLYNATTKAGRPLDLDLIGKIDAPDTSGPSVRSPMIRAARAAPGPFRAIWSTISR